MNKNEKIKEKRANLEQHGEEFKGIIKPLVKLFKEITREHPKE